MRYTSAMATIQIRDLPEETYDTIRKRARAQGQSIQTYMRESVIEQASSPTAADIWDAIDELRDSEPTPGVSTQSIVDDVRAIRGE